MALAVHVIGLLLALPAFAVRPTEGGMYAFDDADVVQYVDDPSGTVRVHYSVEGPNQAKTTDSDADGVFDFPQDVALTAAEVLVFYEQELGLRPPLSEADMGLSELGGSPAFDFYLVDFGGDADGYFGVDACIDAPRHCSGFMVMENDFKSYGYPSIDEAIRVLTSHELFHGVQAAYDAEQPVWFSEGTAVWAERQFDPESDDFLWFAEAYLEDSGRSLDRPPTGPVPSFAYGTALWWDFLTTRHDAALMNELLLATEAPDGEAVDTVRAMEDVIGLRGDALPDAWSTFVEYNVATGDRAGAMDSYTYADEIDGIEPEDEDDAYDDEVRFYPLAATYWRLEHDGGPLFFAAETDGSALRFALHPVVDGAEDGPVEAATATWVGAAELQELGELPAGGYWITATYPEVADDALKVRICFGPEDAAAACVPAVEEQAPPEVRRGCTTAGGIPSWSALGALALVLRRRRRSWG